MFTFAFCGAGWNPAHRLVIGPAALTGRLSGASRTHRLLKRVAFRTVAFRFEIPLITNTTATVSTHFSPEGAFAFLPDGKTALVSDGITVSVYGTAKGSKIRDLPDSRLVRRLSLSSDGKKLVTATLNGEISFWDLPSGRKTWTVPRYGNGRVLSLRFSGRDSRIMAVQSDGSSRFLEAADHFKKPRSHLILPPDSYLLTPDS
jgi:WD40 repeat protein